MTVALPLASVYVTVPASAQTVEDWPMFHHDSQLTGVTASTTRTPDTLRVKWWYLTGQSVIASPAVVGGAVYVGSEDGYFYALSADTGALLWKYKTGLDVVSSAAVANNKVYFGSTDTYLYCLNTADGSVAWKYKTGGPVWSSPNVVGSNVYFGSWDHKVYCLNAANGNLIWNYTTGNRIHRECPSYWNGRIFIGSRDYYMYCLNATTGARLWRYGPLADYIDRSSPSLSQGYLVFGADTDTNYCLNATTGTLVWSHHTPADLYIQDDVESTSAIYNGRVYTGYYAVQYCLDLKTGAEIWSFKTGFPDSSSPALSSSSGREYIGNNDRNLYCLDMSNGNRISSFQTTSDVRSDPAISNGYVYVGSSNGRVYCFTETRAPIATTTTVTAVPSSVAYGQGISVMGGVFPPRLWGGIKITYTKPDGTSETKQVEAKMDGEFADFYEPRQVGTWSVVAVWPGDGVYTASTSAAANFTVTGTVPSVKSTINSWVDPMDIVLGDTTYVRGGIQPMVSATVTLTYTRPDSTTVVRTVTSGADGTYQDSYAPDVTGAWIVRATWTGDATHLGATGNSAFFTVRPVPVSTGGAVTPSAGVPVEVVYAIVAVLVIAIILIVAYMYMTRSRKKT